MYVGLTLKQIEAGVDIKLASLAAEVFSSLTEAEQAPANTLGRGRSVIGVCRGQQVCDFDLKKQTIPKHGVALQNTEILRISKRSLSFPEVHDTQSKKS